LAEGSAHDGIKPSLCGRVAVKCWIDGKILDWLLQKGLMPQNHESKYINISFGLNVFARVSAL